MIFQGHIMQYSTNIQQQMLCKHRVIVSLDSLPQIFTWFHVWNFYLQDKFMAFSLSFFALLEDLNKLFGPAFQHFLLWPEPQLLNTTLNLALWSWKFWWNYSIIDFKAEACVSLMASLWLESYFQSEGGKSVDLSLLLD